MRIHSATLSVLERVVPMKEDTNLPGMLKVMRLLVARLSARAHGLLHKPISPSREVILEWMKNSTSTVMMSGNLNLTMCHGDLRHLIACV